MALATVVATFQLRSPVSPGRPSSVAPTGEVSGSVSGGWRRRRRLRRRHSGAFTTASRSCCGTGSATLTRSRSASPAEGSSKSSSSASTVRPPRGSVSWPPPYARVARWRSQQWSSSRGPATAQPRRSWSETDGAATSGHLGQQRLDRFVLEDAHGLLRAGRSGRRSSCRPDARRQGEDRVCSSGRSRHRPDSSSSEPSTNSPERLPRSVRSWATGLLSATPAPSSRPAPGSRGPTRSSWSGRTAIYVVRPRPSRLATPAPRFASSPMTQSSTYLCSRWPCGSLRLGTSAPWARVGHIPTEGLAYATSGSRAGSLSGSAVRSVWTSAPAPPRRPPSVSPPRSWLTDQERAAWRWAV